MGETFSRVIRNPVSMLQRIRLLKGTYPKSALFSRVAHPMRLGRTLAIATSIPLPTLLLRTSPPTAGGRGWGVMSSSRKVAARQFCSSGSSPRISWREAGLLATRLWVHAAARSSGVTVGVAVGGAMRRRSRGHARSGRLGEMRHLGNSCWWPGMGRCGSG